MHDSRKLNDEYRNYYFIKSDLEDLLGCSIDVNEINKQRAYDKLIETLSPQLISLLPRKKIQLKEAANIIAGHQPFTNSNSTKYLDDVKGYRASLWEAVDEDILEASNEITYYDFGQEWREDITLNKNQVGKWAKKNNLNWPLPIDDDIKESPQNNSELLQRINQLEQELEKQKKINGDYVEVPFYKTHEAFLEAYKQGKHNPTNDREQELTTENNQLKIDNQKLAEQLNEAKKEIDQLKNVEPQNLNNQPKKESAKTINAQSKFIKSLLYIHYGADVANNPRPHIENTSGEIIKDFDAQGLSRELPSYLTVKKWVDSVELDIDS